MKTFSTINFNIIQDVCRRTMDETEMTGLIGYPGAGKTTGLRYYQLSNDNVVYLQLGKSMNDKEFYMEMLSALGYEGDGLGVTLHGLINLVVNKVQSVEDKFLIIIDEAGKFKPGQLEYIHELRDKTQEKMGIVLAGPEYFYDNLYRWKQKRVVGIPEIFRRISTFETLKPPTRNEIKTICRHYGITDHKILKNRFYDCTDFDELNKEIKKYLSN